MRKRETETINSRHFRLGDKDAQIEPIDKEAKDRYCKGERGAQAKVDSNQTWRLRHPCLRLIPLWAQVQRSEPAVLTGLMEDWPALSMWTDDYLARVVGRRTVAVSVSEGSVHARSACMYVRSA
eukprot:6179096-Pleurochrysis_carterae.AAC.1